MNWLIGIIFIALGIFVITFQPIKKHYHPANNIVLPKGYVLDTTNPLCEKLVSITFLRERS